MKNLLSKYGRKGEVLASVSFFKGFTLIELVITIVVIAVLSIPVSLMLTEYIYGLYYETGLTYAYQVLQLEMERIFNYYYGQNFKNLHEGTYSSSDIIPVEDPVSRDYPIDVEIVVAFEEGNLDSEESLKKIIIYAKNSNDGSVIVSAACLMAKNSYCNN